MLFGEGSVSSNIRQASLPSQSNLLILYPDTFMKVPCGHYYLQFTDAEFRARPSRNDVLRKYVHLNWTWFSMFIYVLIQKPNVQQQRARF